MREPESPQLPGIFPANAPAHFAIVAEFAFEDVRHPHADELVFVIIAVALHPIRCIRGLQIQRFPQSVVVSMVHRVVGPRAVLASEQANGKRICRRPNPINSVREARDLTQNADLPLWTMSHNLPDVTIPGRPKAQCLWRGRRPQNTILRYGRLKICATTANAQYSSRSALDDHNLAGEGRIFRDVCLLAQGELLQKNRGVPMTFATFIQN